MFSTAHIFRSNQQVLTEWMNTMSIFKNWEKGEKDELLEAIVGFSKTLEMLYMG